MKLRLWAAFLITIIGGVAIGLCAFRYARPNDTIILPTSLPKSLRSAAPQIFIPVTPPLERPYGMAPVAFEAYLRACNNAGINPHYRLAQTIGDHPRSVGYHKQDGILHVKGEAIPYCAAVDMEAFSLTEAQRTRFLEAMAQQGFALWYRSGPRWKNGEHIHAVYALLPMKSQLRGQVRQFVRERRNAGKPRLKWETKRRKLWRKWGYAL